MITPLVLIAIWLVFSATVFTALVVQAHHAERYRIALEDDVLALAIAVNVLSPDSVGWRR